MDHKRIAMFISLIVFCFCGCGMKEAADTAVFTEESSAAEEASEKEVFLPEYEVKADLTHDGTDEVIKVTVEESEYKTQSAFVSVYSGDKKIYEEENPVHAVHGKWYGLVLREEGAYLMMYAPLIDHSEITCEYEVFSLDDAGKRIELSSSAIKKDFWHMDTFDKEEWCTFAEEENNYFKDATLLVTAVNGELKTRDMETPQTYEENFAWTVSYDPDEWESNKTPMEKNLDAFLAENMDEFNALMTEAGQ